MKVLLVVPCLLLVSIASWAASILPPPPQVAGSAYFLIDAYSGRVIVEHNADVPLAPASLTKLMTGYVLSFELAAARVSDDDQVLISREAWSQNPIFDGSSLMLIQEGKRVKLEDLHRGLVISSGNDAAVAIAEHVAGAEDAFADMMNGHAQSLGMTGSHFVNSHGLSAKNHYTTARDLAIVANALVSHFPVDYALYQEQEFTYNGERQFNRNTLLAGDLGVDGLKTGYTSEAGYCLVASAKRDNMRLISVVLGAASKYARESETRKLLNYGFRFYETREFYASGQELASTQVWKGLQEQVSVVLAAPIVLTIPRGRSADLEAVVEVPDSLVAPVGAGQALGELTISLDGETLRSQPLVAAVAVEQAGFLARLWDSILMFLADIFGS